MHLTLIIAADEKYYLENIQKFDIYATSYKRGIIFDK